MLAFGHKKSSEEGEHKKRPAHQVKISAKGVDLGDFRIHEQVIASIAGVVISETDGVYPMSYGLANEMATIFHKRKFEKGIKLDQKDGKLVIHVFLKVAYGINIPQVIKELQEKISVKVFEMTNLEIHKIIIDIQGINFEP